MHRFYCPHMHSAPTAGSSSSEVNLSDATVLLDREESHHAARVLRMTQGSEVGLFNGCGLSATGIVEHVHKTQVTVKVTHAAYEPPPSPQVWIAAAVAKGGKADDMVDQLSQINAARWIPLITERSVVDPRQSKIEKLRKTAVAAAKQSGRSHLLEISDPHSLKESLALPGAMRLWATTHSDDQVEDNLQGKLQAAGSEPVIIYIGPEGGWTRQEEKLAQDAEALGWRLGEQIMRVETAAAVAAALVMYLGRSRRS